MLPLIAGLFFVLATINLWSEIYFSLFGVRTSGEVIEFHASRARSISITAEIEVDMPGTAPFRWEVDDAFGTQNWEVRGTVPLLCARLHPDHMSCVLDSWLDRFLFPLIAISIGTGVLLWMVRRRHAGAQ
jgi:hypothetical protein